MAEAASPRPRSSPGVSRELARWRARALRRRALRRSNARDSRAGRELEGELELRVAVRGKPVDLVLDWRPPPGRRGSSRSRRTASRSTSRASCASTSSSRRGTCAPGENVVRLRFESPIATAGTAVTLYRDREDGAEYVYSLFVPSDASTVFPCFDQPDLKARFTLVARRCPPAGKRCRTRRPSRRPPTARRSACASARPSRSAPISSPSPPGRSRSSTTARTASRRSPRRACSCGSRGSRARRREAYEMFRLHRQAVVLLRRSTSASRSRSRSTTWCSCPSSRTAAWSTPAPPSCARSRCCSRSSRPRPTGCAARSSSSTRPRTSGSATSSRCGGSTTCG